MAAVFDIREVGEDLTGSVRILVVGAGWPCFEIASQGSR